MSFLHKGAKSSMWKELQGLKKSPPPLSSPSQSNSNHKSMEGTSGHENDDLPCISLDLEKAINLSCNPTQNINPPRVRLVKPRALSFENPVGRVCRSPVQTAPDAATIGGVSANSPRMNSSRKFFNSITVKFWAIICRGPSCSQNGRVGRHLTQALNFPNNKGKRHCAILVDYPHQFQEIPWLPRRRRNGGQKGGRSGLNQGRRSRGLRRVCYVYRGIDSGGGGIGDNDSGERERGVGVLTLNGVCGYIIVVAAAAIVVIGGVLGAIGSDGLGVAGDAGSVGFRADFVIFRRQEEPDKKSESHFPEMENDHRARDGRPSLRSGGLVSAGALALVSSKPEQ
nr:uncharacterized serine-rich protein C215.13-like [Ipomoea batatas]